MPLFITRGVEPSQARATLRQVADKKLRQVTVGVYTDDLHRDIDAVVRTELFALCAVLVPNGLISHRSALELRPTPEGDFFLTGESRRDVELPGLRLRVSKGPGPLDSDIAIPTAFGPIYRSSDARALLENLQPARARAGSRRTFDQKQIQDRIDRKITQLGLADVNALRDQARRLAVDLSMTAQFKKLDMIIGAMLGTREYELAGNAAKARAAGRPYDSDRIQLFDRLLTELLEQPISRSPHPEGSDVNLMAFVESYFSNYIEGTEFELEEAHDIVMKGEPLEHREDDSRDILGTYAAILASLAQPRVPKSADEFIANVKRWNAQAISSRSSKRPGEFKDKVNRYGATVFVDPELVAGTLEKGFERISALEDAMAKSAMTMFVLAEVHPFLDGNGRTARLGMNEVLTAAGLRRLIVPSVFRDDYILALNALSHNQDGVPYIRMLGKVASFSAWLDFSSEERCFAQLHESNALLKPHQAKLKLPAATPPARSHHEA